MSIKQRAVTNEQRQERRLALLQAAWQLFQNNSYEAINIVDVARAAGLAKGTVYLYFDTKEALFLAVQEQQLAEWFAALEGELVKLAGSGHSASVAQAICRTMNERPALARLLAILHLILEQNIDYPTARAFKQSLLSHILRLGAALEACLPSLQPGQGTQATMWIYTFLLGLQQVANPAPVVKEVLAANPGMEVFEVDFCRHCQAVITTLLSGLGQPIPPPTL